jgi:hypothetical protein
VRGTPYEEFLKVAPAEERPRTTVEERMRLIEDRQAIAGMIDEYGLCCDAGWWERLTALYAEDIEREILGTLAETVRGRDELIGLHRNPVLPRAAGVNTVKVDLGSLQNREIRHLISTRIIRIADDSQAAWALAYYQMAVVGQRDGAWKRGEHEGTYVFTFTRKTGHWQFAQHLVWSNNAVNPMFAAPGPAGNGG